MDVTRAPSSDDREQLARRIEQAGYRLDGWHDVLEDLDAGYVTVRATHRANGESHSVTIHQRGPDGERAALEELARRLGLSNA
jgi:hypothetical protein